LILKEVEMISDANLERF